MSTIVHPMPGHVKPRKKSEHHALKLARFQLMAKAQLVNLGLALEERRKQLGLSRTVLAQRFPVDPKTVERWERGKNAGAFNNLAEVAQHLETTPEALQARAVAIAQRNGDRPNQTEPAEGVADLIDLDNRAKARHVEMMKELGEIRGLLEAQETTAQQDGHTEASGQ